MKAEKTAVIYRTFKDGGDVIAIFPFIPSDPTGWHCESYQHVGQHGGCTPHLTHAVTRPATRAEIAPLAKELRRIGYKLRELKRVPRNAYSVRLRAIAKARPA